MRVQVIDIVGGRAAIHVHDAGEALGDAVGGAGCRPSAIGVTNEYCLAQVVASTISVTCRSRSTCPALLPMRSPRPLNVSGCTR